MRKGLIKFLSIILSSVSILNTSFNSFAYTLDADGNSIEQIEYQNSEDENFSNTSNVFAEISNIYNITIPKTIVLNGQEKKASYYVKVEGDIAGYQVLNVVPDDFFYLYSINKDGAITSIYQDKTSWTYDEFNVLAEGTVLADFITAGKWKGTFNFNIFIDEERVAGDIILPDSLKDYKLVISKIEDLPGLYDIEGNLLVKYSTLETDLGLNEEIPNSTFSNIYPSNLSTSLGDIINTDYPEGVFLSLPESVDTIENNAFTNTNIKYVYLPESVQEIGDDVFPEDTICVNLPRKVKHIGRVNKNIPIYQKGYPVKELEIDFEDIKNMKEDDVLTLYKGYRYKIEALYNFNDDVTGQSTIKSSNENIVQYNPVYFLDAINTGTCFISGTYNTPSGKANAQIKLKVISDKNYTKHKHIKGETKKENIIDGTCSEKGSYDLVTYCKACGKKIEVKKIETDFKHNWTLSVKENATCDTDSLEAYVCSNCGETKITHDIKATGHNIVKSVVTAPTCTKQGFTTHTCSKCNKTIIDTYVNATGHTYNSNGKCTKCGDFNVSKLSSGLYTVNGNTYTRKYTWAQLINKGYYKVENGALKLQGINTTVNTSSHANDLTGFLVIDSSVTSLPNCSGYMLDKLTGIYIPKSVQNIQIGYTDYWKVSNIKIDSANPYFEVSNGALYTKGKKELVLVPHTVTGTFSIDSACEKIRANAFRFSSYSTVNLTNKLKYIGNVAFGEMPNLTTLSIPASVTTIENGITNSSSKVSSITINSANPNYTVSNGSLYTKDMKRIISVPCAKSGTFNIPNTVQTVGSSAFNGCTKLTKITIPESVTSMGTWAFSNCLSVKSINIPSKITRIEVGSFWNVPAPLTIPANVTFIGYRAISKASSVTFKDTSKSWTVSLVSGGTKVNNKTSFTTNVKNASTNANNFKTYIYYNWTRK